MESKEIKIQYLISIFFTANKPLKIPFGLRIFIIGRGNYVRVYNGHIETGSYLPEFRLGHELKFERGKILDFFAKLEFLVNEFYFVKMMPNEFTNGYILDKYT